MSKEYIVECKIFVVKKFVLRQWELLLGVLGDINFGDKKALTIRDIIVAVSSQLSKLMSIALVEKGQVFDKAKIAENEEFLGNRLDADQVYEVISDFLVVTPVNTLREKFQSLFLTNPLKTGSKT